MSFLASHGMFGGGGYLTDWHRRSLVHASVAQSGQSGRFVNVWSQVRILSLALRGTNTWLVKGHENQGNLAVPYLCVKHVMVGEVGIVQTMATL